MVVGGDFKILRRLGEGGMGLVFAAQQMTTGYERALKIMHAPFAVDPRARERFEQEARIGARIRSDHVVQVVAAGIDDHTHTPWLAMELLEGEDLERHIKTRGPMSLADVAQVIGQVIHALAAAHEVGVVHRDIKPENVFLSISRIVGVPFMVKILDFGIAKLRSNVRRATLAVGTPGYMAPEQSQSSDEIGPAADVWPLGLMVFRMLTGGFFWRSMAEGGGMPKLWREMLIDPIPRASERAAEFGTEHLLPEGFDDWFAACVEREPSLRFANAKAAGRALDHILRAAGIDSSMGSETSSEISASLGDNRTGSAPEMLATGGLATQDLPTGALPIVTLPQTTAPAPETMLPTHRVSFRERNERVVAFAREGETLLDASLAAGIPHYHACGGNARCSTCRVVVLSGRDQLSRRTEAEERIAFRRKWPATTRLACQAKILGPCMVRRLVIDPNDASVADMSRTTQSGARRVQQATVVVLRLDGIDDVLADGFPDDAIHVLERCLAPVGELIDDNGGRLVGLEGTRAIAAFDAGPDGVRRALRVGLRAAARIRQLNPYLLKHFGAQVGTAVGIGGGVLLEGTATTATLGATISMGHAVREARAACDSAARSQVLAPKDLVEGLDLVTSPGPGGLLVVRDFAKSDIVFLVQTSFDQLAGQAMPFAQAFYDELFDIHPAAIPLFEHTDMGRQQKMLVDTLALAVRGLDDFEKIQQAVRELGERHVDYGASLRDYKFVGQALIGTIERFLGDAFTPEIELAWREVYSTLVRTMTEGLY